MIKQIQLRGISRTPSDRLTEDGGLSESLNMYLDTAESAPAFIPQDVTSKLKLPADLQAERVFIHKGTTYEHFIIQQGRALIAIVNNVTQPLVSLKEEETLSDINSIGNILIVATSSSVHYILWKNKEYQYIGNKLPLPTLRFETEANNEEYLEPAKAGGTIRLDTSGDVSRMPISRFESTYWEQAARGINETEGANEYLNEVHNNLWAAIQEKKSFINKWGYFCCPRFARYAIRLYDGSYIYHSVPILIGAGEESWVSARGFFQTLPSGSLLSQIDFSIPLYYKAVAKLIHWEVDGWEDIISGIDVFISTDITFPTINATFDTVEDGGGRIYFKGDKDAFETSKNEVLSKSNFYKVFSIGVRELSKLKEGVNLHDNDFVDDNSLLVQQERLTSDYMSNHAVVPSSMATFNNSLVINGTSISLPDAPSELNGLVASGDFPPETYRMKFYIKKNNGEEYSILARTYAGSTDLETPFFPYYSSVPGEEDNGVYTMPYAWIAYPDVNCYKVEIDTYSAIHSIEMEQHPSLFCSYAFIGLNKPWDSIPVVSGTFDETEESNSYSIENQVMASMMNNPFVFPLESRFSFQSKVLGIAIATTALSQGQFGQFPFYVFTEDGIWAMETSADGSFVSQKPLSREVCTNPDSITSIDNAVVFVTDKGVMMIQGSQVMNISPYMNGRHYTPNDSATNIIARQEGFGEFENAIKDETPFVAFMKKAKIAYDYAGQRLICIADDETFQYIYKLDTQTWHKVAFNGFDLIAPLNSYPDCLVQGKVDVDIKTYWIIDAIESPSDKNIQSVRQAFDAEAGLQVSISEARAYLKGQAGINVNNINDTELLNLGESLAYSALDGIVRIQTTATKIYSLGTILDVDPKAEDAPKVSKGILITRPFDLGMPDVFKSITSIKIRGDFDKGNVKYILQGSDDGKTFYTMNTLRGKSWKMFRIFILADLEPTERISWIDIDFEPRYNNRLR